MSQKGRMRKRIAAEASLEPGPQPKRRCGPTIVVTADPPVIDRVRLVEKLCLDVEMHAAGHFAAVRRATSCVAPGDDSLPAMCLHVADPRNAACSHPLTLPARQLSAVDVRIPPLSSKSAVPRSLHVLLELREPLAHRATEDTSLYTPVVPRSPDTITALRATGVTCDSNGKIAQVNNSGASTEGQPETILAALPRRQRLVQVQVPMEHAAVVTGTLEAMIEANAQAGVRTRKGLPTWVGSVPAPLYCRTLRRMVEMATTAWFVFSVFWALWQLYHNLDSVHALLEPVRRRLQAHVQHAFAAVNTWLLTFSGWWVEWWRPVSFLLTALFSPLSNNRWLCTISSLLSILVAPFKWSMQIFSIQVSAVFRGIWAAGSLVLTPFIFTVQSIYRIGNAAFSAVFVPIGRQSISALLMLLRPFLIVAQRIGSSLSLMFTTFRMALTALLTVAASCLAPFHRVATLFFNLFRRLPTKVKKDDFEPGKVLLVNAGKAVAAAAQTTMTHVRANGSNTPRTLSPAANHVSASGLSLRRTPTPPPPMQLPPNEIDEAKLARVDRRS